MKRTSLLPAAVLATSVSMASSTALAGLPPPTQQISCWSYTDTNSARGDIVLTTTNGLIRSLINAIGQTYTHTGMSVSSSSIVHNTMDTNAIETVGGLIPSNLNSVGYKSLRDGWPGTVNEAWANALTKSFRWDSSLVLTGPAHLATQRSNAASQITQLNGNYRLYAYTDMTWKNPTVRGADDGNMCSGTVANAAFRAGILPATMRQAYTAAVRQQAAQVLYDATYKNIYNKAQDSEAFFKFQSFFGGTDLQRFAEKSANQVVNCMAFNDCGNTGTRWRAGVGAGNTLSPDDLMTIAALYAFASAYGGGANPYPYQQTKPLQISNVYCCTYPALGSNPATYSCSTR